MDARQKAGHDEIVGLIMRRVLRIIRNILLLAIAIVVILAAVLAFNTFTHGSRQLQVAAVPRAEVDTQAAAKRLAEAIRFRTISSYEKPDQHADALRGMRTHIEKSKWVKVLRWGGAEDAHRLILEGIERAKKK